MKVWPLVALAWLSISASAAAVDGVTASSVCGANGYSTVSGFESCRLSGSHSVISSASTNVAFEFAETVSDFSVIRGWESSLATNPQDTMPFGLPSYAQSSLDWDLTLSTNGPVRQGYLVATLAGGGNEEDGGAFAGGYVRLPQSIGLGVSQLGCSASNSGCGSSIDLLSHYSPMIPWTLGEDFTLHYSAFAYAMADLYSGNEAQSSITFSFRFIELNGDPVATVVPAPEPAFCKILLTSAGILALRRRAARARAA